MQIITREDAVALGLRRYFTSKPCKRGHIVERRTSDRMCMQCLRDRSAKDRVRLADYYAAYQVSHREKTRAACRIYYAERADQMREYARAYRRTNAEAVRSKDRLRANSDARKASRMLQYEKHGHKARERERRRYQKEHLSIKFRVAKYREENPDKVREQRRPGVNAARARKKAAEGSFTRSDIQNLVRTQNGLCAACPTELGSKYHVDHIQPLSCSGSNWPSNLQLLCAPCNLSKGRKTMDEWLSWKAEMAAYSIST